MDIIIDFTTGLSGSVAWPWPIAVYLFLAGISGGAVALAIILNILRKEEGDNPQMKAATMVGLVTILLGMLCLVCDLTDPLQFWRILIYYNPTSVMSIGVAGSAVLHSAAFCADPVGIPEPEHSEVSQTAIGVC